MKRILGSLVFLLALIPGLFGHATAQEVITVQTNRGWIGITFNLKSAFVGDVEQTVVVIENVVKGSPAEMAGLRVGDTLTHIDGQPISQRVFTSLGNLEEGDLVRMTVRRENRPVEVLVEAGRRPERPEPIEWVVAPNSGAMVVHLDSIRGAMLKNLDSLRVNISRVGVDPSGRFSISILEAPGEEARSGEEQTFYFGVPSGDSTGAFGEFFLPDVSPVPFGAFIVGTEETDSLKTELQGLRKALTEVRRAELTRIREIQGGVQRSVEEEAARDETVLELRAQERELLEEQARVTRELRTRTDEIMRSRMARIQEEQMEALARMREAQSESRSQWEQERRAEERAVREQYESQRPGSHIILGQRFVAGAQFTPLNPELAEYFQADEGVLVTEVLEGTPADEAGLQAGDVIVRVGSEAVTSLEDLRFALGYLDRPLRIQVIRKGSPVEIVFHR